MGTLLFLFWIMGAFMQAVYCIRYATVLIMIAAA